MLDEQVVDLVLCHGVVAGCLSDVDDIDVGVELVDQRARRRAVDHDDVRLCEQLPSPGRDEPGSPGPPPTSETEPSPARRRREGASGFELCLQGITDRDNAVRIAAAVTATSTSPIRAMAGVHALDRSASSARTHHARRPSADAATESSVSRSPVAVWTNTRRRGRRRRRPVGATGRGRRRSTRRASRTSTATRPRRRRPPRERQHPPCRDRSAADNDDAPAGDVEHEWVRRLAHQWIPHSDFACPAHRPDRASSPAATGRVHGAPMEVSPICRSGLTRMPCSATYPRPARRSRSPAG